MKIFVTGGTGFIGGHLISRAQTEGHQVLALRRPGSLPRIVLESQPQWLDGELVNNWSDALAGCEAFVHLAAFGVANGAHDWERCFQVNVLDSIRLWRQAISSGIRLFLIAGSCFEYGRSGERYDAIPVTAPLEPTTAYGASKAAASMAALALAKEYQLRLAVARPFHVYGEGEAPGRFWPSLVAAAKAGDDLPMTEGQQIRDFQPVELAANQLLSLLSNSSLKAGEPVVINMGTGHPTSLYAFAEREWQRHKAKGSLLPGALPYRTNEVLRYVPEVSGQHLPSARCVASSSRLPEMLCAAPIPSIREALS
jgi:UDP-glucose 4-epimerase